MRSKTIQLHKPVDQTFSAISWFYMDCALTFHDLSSSQGQSYVRANYKSKISYRLCFAYAFNDRRDVIKLKHFIVN